MTPEKRIEIDRRVAWACDLAGLWPGAYVADVGALLDELAESAALRAAIAQLDAENTRVHYDGEGLRVLLRRWLAESHGQGCPCPLCDDTRATLPGHEAAMPAEAKERLARWRREREGRR